MTQTKAHLARIELHPSGDVFHVEVGQPLRDLLFGNGMEFPCGGRAQCKACRIKVLQGHLPPTAREQSLLSPEEIADGWRLACLARVHGDLRLELAQWSAPILADETPFAFTPRTGLGVAVDLGTTTLAAQLLDLQTGQVRAVQTALNPQATHGADLMSRIAHAVQHHAQPELQHQIRREIGRMIAALLDSANIDPGALAEIAIVGNTAMHHLFSGIDVVPLAAYPFEPDHTGWCEFTAAALDWPFATPAAIRFLPCMGGFVGSDVLAGVLAAEMHKSDRLIGLVDLGTNGEIVVGNRQRILCASTAAGPAFEGACISSGMRASTGAIAGAERHGGHLRFRVLGGQRARGICGSGLVDVVANALDLGWILPSGRLNNGNGHLDLADGIQLTQADIRQLQLAKGAIAAGLRLLIERLGACPGDLDKLYLAGAFGNYISRPGARRIGLLLFAEDKIHSAGNTALLGAKIALFPSAMTEIEQILTLATHVPLGADPQFQEAFVEEMAFPEIET